MKWKSSLPDFLLNVIVAAVVVVIKERTFLLQLIQRTKVPRIMLMRVQNVAVVNVVTLLMFQRARLMFLKTRHQREVARSKLLILK